METVAQAPHRMVIPRVGVVGDDWAAWAAELVIKRDGSGEVGEALRNAFAQALERYCAVAFEREAVATAPEDALHALADRRPVRSAAGARRDVETTNRRVDVADGSGERVDEQDLASLAATARHPSPALRARTLNTGIRAFV